MKHYVGIDVSKSKLDIYLDKKNLSVENNSAGLSFLIEKLNEQISQGHEIGLVLCEASGGYEKLLVDSLRAENFPVHLAHANKIRAFAKAKGLLAKTDKIDARIISEYGFILSPMPDKKLISSSAELLGELLKRREQLLDQRQGEKNRLDKECLPAVIESIKSHIKWLEDEIKRLDEQINKQQCQDDFKNQIDLLASIPGIGRLTASYLISFLPELGKINHKQIAALVGVAPFNRDSGTLRGKRFIQGGRAVIRKILYMATLASIRCRYSDMRVFYQHLINKGKPGKIAVVATMRKLLLVLNSVMRRQTPWVQKMEIYA